MPLTDIGPINYTSESLVIRMKTKQAAFLHANLLKGLVASQKLALEAEDLTPEEREGVLALNEMLLQLMPPGEVCKEAVTPALQVTWHSAS